ncbi:hypothetical protein KC332_g14435 [Hortaea werneckii]|nr:hypothetical protein KC350_g14499 [Hortaea werneckii]KAI6821573.1 hypothetical protein KC358_g9081 [Hortaea werneckii]KAI6906941.1 hypothetical protein KC348_g14448 [Hortaea werneckii]KAI6924198.1 hypothetical protein KC341_g14205 [Hortaea werneckii]KAI6957824.1 hypothetical protein KC321_g14362 [Hortaea werneckii]
MDGEVDFNRFERKRGSGLWGVVRLEKEMREEFEGSGDDFGEVGAGYQGLGVCRVGGEGEGEDQAESGDQGQVEDDEADEAEAEAEDYGDEDEESGPEEASLDDLLLSTDLLSLNDSKAMYAQWKDRKPSKPTPGTDDTKEQEEIDIAFVEAIPATNAIKWGNSASIRDISPSSNDPSTIKPSQKRPSARATRHILFKLHVPRDYGKNPYYTADWTLEDAAKHIRLTLTEANTSCKQWLPLHSREEFESLIQKDGEMQSRLNNLCQDLGYMAQLVEYGREGWDLAELSKMVLDEVSEAGGSWLEGLGCWLGIRGVRCWRRLRWRLW